MSDLILHHFDTSPFSEKVRLAFGLKGLNWNSVTIPSMLPKPDYVPLTGGYRRTPSMQIGADVYCDSQVILAEIDARHPHAPLVQGGMDWAVNIWADRLFFQATVPIIFGVFGDQVGEAFIKDRSEMSGRPFDVAAMKAAGPPMQQQWRAHASWIETALSSSPSGWLSGPNPGLADISAYMNVWFLKRNLPDVAARLLAGLDLTQAWAERVAAIGHGSMTPMAAADALTLAKTSSPAPVPASDADDAFEARPGDRVVVFADDYGRDQVAGSLVSLSPQRVIIARDHDQTGPVHVHFPRVGFVVAKA